MVGLAAAVAAIGAAAATAPLKIEVKPPLVMVGSPVAVVVAPGVAGDERMTVEMKRCSDSTWSTVAAARLWPDGYWTATLQPGLNALVRARVREATSAPARVEVRPYVNLDVLAKPWFRVEVGIGRYLTGKRVYVERFSAGAWKRAASVRLARDRAFSYAISSARFRLRVAKGTRIRAVIPATSCYVKGVSDLEVAR